MSLMLRLALSAMLLLSTLLTVPAWAAPVRNLPAPEAFERLRDQPRILLLDVRTPGEYFQVRIAGAQLIPIDQLLGRLGEIPRDRPILVYCAVGLRSSQVSTYLAQQGYPEVYNLTGGIAAWQLRGYPTLQGPP